MAETSIAIIGAGMSGLSAGCYGQMNGYRTRIFEMHDKSGGLCTSWKRQGYTISTPGWPMGSGPTNNDFYRFWEELGALQGRTFVDFEEFGRIEGKDGQVFALYTDIGHLEQHLVELAPEDEAAIAEFILVLRTFAQFKAPMDLASELSGPPHAFEMPPYMMKYMGMPLGAFANEFKNPFLREALVEALPEIFFSCPEASMAMMLNALAHMHLKAAGYPLGGFLKLVRAIERRYLNLGGDIHYNSRVVSILVEDDRAVGVRLEDGTEHRSDIVISAADGRTTIFDTLQGEYANDEIRGYYESLPLYPPILLISLGLDRTFEESPPSVVGTVFPLDEPLTIAGGEYEWLVPHRADFDPTLAPEGRTLLKVTLASD